MYGDFKWRLVKCVIQDNEGMLPKEWQKVTSYKKWVLKKLN